MSEAAKPTLDAKPALDAITVLIKNLLDGSATGFGRAADLCSTAQQIVRITGCRVKDFGGLRSSISCLPNYNLGLNITSDDDNDVTDNRLVQRNLNNPADQFREMLMMAQPLLEAYVAEVRDRQRTCRSSELHFLVESRRGLKELGGHEDEAAVLDKKIKALMSKLGIDKEEEVHGLDLVRPELLRRHQAGATRQRPIDACASIEAVSERNRGDAGNAGDRDQEGLVGHTVDRERPESRGA